MHFAEVGDHCSMTTCNRQDFLPFKCDCCNNTYCLEHRTYSAHNCPKAQGKNLIAIICPLCKQTIPITADTDANHAWDLHSRTVCDPSNRKKKQRCSVQNCKSKLGPLNKVVCEKCRLEVCLNHRFPDAHNCQGRRGTIGRATEKRNINSMFGTNTNIKKNSNTNTNTNKNKDRSSPAPAIRSFDNKHLLTETADRRRQDRENCPHCSATFSNPIDLITHVEANHLSSQANTNISTRISSRSSAENLPSPPNYVDLTRTPPKYTVAQDVGLPPSYSNISANRYQNSSGGCPFCAANFTDPVELVNHVESFHHNDSNNNNKRITTTGDKKDCCVS